MRCCSACAGHCKEPCPLAFHDAAKEVAAIANIGRAEPEAVLLHLLHDVAALEPRPPGGLTHGLHDRFQSLEEARAMGQRDEALVITAAAQRLENFGLPYELQGQMQLHQTL